MRKMELLAPAGSYESLQAAFLAGADAVYAGGSRFGARAYAQNLSDEELLSAIDLAHVLDKRFYLTLNTLLKKEELEKTLYNYICPLYEAGLDGVIVQDVGVISFLKRSFPDLPLHASTQMTVTGVDSARFLKEQGFRRIVPARELSLKELELIKKETQLELEVFIHGALCYCYSGQCLFSSLIGGRSGNRGRCAQPCRLPYSVTDCCSKLTDAKYYLSPKDLCGLHLIPELYRIGTDSLKIEGRMKNPAYTSGVVGIYRKYLDRYENLIAAAQTQKDAKHSQTWIVEQTDLDFLMDIFNRGGMTEGYAHQYNSGKMISAYRANHYGLLVGRGTVSGNRASIRLEKTIGKGDVLELRTRQEQVICEIQAKDERPAGEKYTISIIQNAPLYTSQNSPGNTAGDRTARPSSAGKNSIRNNRNCKAAENDEFFLYRTRNEQLLNELKMQMDARHLQRMVSGKAVLSVGKPAQMTVWDDRFSVTVEGDLVQKAKNQPLTEETAAAQLRRTGGTLFYFQKMTCICEGSVFLPKQSLNALRRKALDAFRVQIRASFSRKENSGMPESHTPAIDEEKNYLFAASAETIEQLSVLLEWKELKRIDFDSDLLAMAKYQQPERQMPEDLQKLQGKESPPSLKKQQLCMAALQQMCIQLHLENRKLYCRMPAVFRAKTRARYDAWFPEIAACVDGFVARNMDVYGYLLQKKQELNVSYDILCDFTIYAMQPEAAAFWKNPDGPWNHQVDDFNQQNNQPDGNKRQHMQPARGEILLTAPVELNFHELKENKGCYDELLVYGRLPMMVSAGCVAKTRQYLISGKDTCNRNAKNDRRNSGNPCIHSENVLYLTDRFQKQFPVRQFCTECYNVIYNSLPLSLLDCGDEIAQLSIPALRLSFTTESDRETAEILTNFTNAFTASAGGVGQKQDTARNLHTDVQLQKGTFTRGHFKRGVE